MAKGDRGWMFWRRTASRREIESHVEGYREGRRLMRHGDGADEWIGMSLTKEHLLALIGLGLDTEGRKVSPERRAEILAEHGLHKRADELFG